MDKSSVIAKVKACFNLASAKSNTSEAEMATALSLAKRLMAKHNLSEAEVMLDSDAAEPTIEETTVETRVNPHKYEYYLANVCEILFSVKAIRHISWDPKVAKRRNTLKFVGYPADVELAKTAYAQLRQTINSMAMYCGFIEAERDQWRVGVTYTLLRRAHEASTGLTEDEENKCKALVSVKDQKIREHLGELTQSRMQGPTLTKAYLKGKRDGETVDMNFRNKLTN